MLGDGGMRNGGEGEDGGVLVGVDGVKEVDEVEWSGNVVVAGSEGVGEDELLGCEFPVRVSGCG